MPSSNGRSTAACTARIADFQASKPRNLRRILLADLVEDFRLAARGLDLVVEVADAAQRHMRVDHLAGKRDRALAQLPFLDQRIHHIPFERLFGAEWRARKNEVERIFDPRKARQALCATGAGHEPELDFGQADLRRGRGHAVMAHQRDFEAAAERCPMQSGDHRLRTAFERALDFGKRCALRRLAELGNIRARDKGAARADQDDRFDRGVRCCLPGAVAKAVAHVGRQCVDRRRIDREHGDIAFTGQIGYGIDGGHRAAPLQLAGWSYAEISWRAKYVMRKGEGRPCRCST